MKHKTVTADEQPAVSNTGRMIEETSVVKIRKRRK